ncbi:Surface antigen D15-like protein [Gracilaria domingensis]|nr:Surface antigen D15-like protein [Gracilaria domingensis]
MSTDGRVFGDISVSDNNFMGRAQRLRVAWQKRLDEGRSSGGLIFEDMRIGAAVPISFKLKAYRDSSSKRGIPIHRSARGQGTYTGGRNDDRDFDSQLFYEKDRDGIMVDIGFRPKDTYIMFNLTPKYEFIHPNLVDALSSTTTSQLVLQHSYTHATRLPVELPRSGHLARIEHSIGNVLHSPGRPFQKAVFSLSQYFGVQRYASIALAGIAGFGSDNLPWHEQKSLGGHTNVRGYSYGELGRHKSYATARAELRIPLTHLEAAAGPQEPVEEKQKGTDSKANGQNANSNEEKAGEESKKLSGVESKLPPLVGVIFGDVALTNSTSREVLGTSYGVGIRIAGIVSVDWTRTVEDGRSSVHVGLVDRSW